ncbi:LOW QUALITY PROTEIN: hypothetical protein DAPPUDRAFT_261918 [Daphnia pulex]|uniref:Uncharacterized protein n=1 Tax=Daphnia pulex TaxID=6669 RepID=E9HLX7_DAPPU|nr:LOW QUALITY PROTEIN: hypothetical protein DAPPUDRAFT_261918 [Daphnia pulex]|eukprot:EFX67261.1 LOW QUALITY PROTEIN: hypothetical protein DAPPUDRAFT_261918 [Daphnia pulex]
MTTPKPTTSTTTTTTTPNPTTSTTSQTTTKVTTTTSKTTTKSPTATTPTTTKSTTSPTTTTHTPPTTSATTTSTTTVATTTAMERKMNPTKQPTFSPIFPEPAQSTISLEAATTQQQTPIPTNNSDPQPEQPEIDSLYLNESSLDAAIWVEEPIEEVAYYDTSTATYPEMTKPTTTIHRVTKAINSSADDYSGYNPAQNVTNPVTMDRRTLSEFMAPIMQSFHEQFKQHLEIQHENELAKEIRQMYCHVSVLRRLQAVTLSQTNGLLAASNYQHVHVYKV